jgi:hypothetical protein
MREGPNIPLHMVYVIIDTLGASNDLRAQEDCACLDVYPTAKAFELSVLDSAHAA